MSDTHDRIDQREKTRVAQAVENVREFLKDPVGVMIDYWRDRGAVAQIQKAMDDLAFCSENGATMRVTSDRTEDGITLRAIPDHQQELPLGLGGLSTSQSTANIAESHLMMELREDNEDHRQTDLFNGSYGLYVRDVDDGRDPFASWSDHQDRVETLTRERGRSKQAEREDDEMER